MHRPLASSAPRVRRGATVFNDARNKKVSSVKKRCNTISDPRFSRRDRPYLSSRAFFAPTAFPRLDHTFPDIVSDPSQDKRQSIFLPRRLRLWLIARRFQHTHEASAKFLRDPPCSEHPLPGRSEVPTDPSTQITWILSNLHVPTSSRMDLPA
jgi:hypothetical protein